MKCTSCNRSSQQIPLRQFPFANEAKPRYRCRGFWAKPAILMCPEYTKLVSRSRVKRSYFNFYSCFMHVRRVRSVFICSCNSCPAFCSFFSNLLHPSIMYLLQEHQIDFFSLIQSRKKCRYLPLPK